MFAFDVLNRNESNAAVNAAMNQTIFQASFIWKIAIDYAFELILNTSGNSFENALHIVNSLFAEIFREIPFSKTKTKLLAKM